MGANESSEGEPETCDELPSWIELPKGDGPKQEEALPLPSAQEVNDAKEPAPQITSMANKDKVRIRIPSPTREQGDGMELPDASETMVKLRSMEIADASETLVKLLPQSKGIALDSLEEQKVMVEKCRKVKTEKLMRTGIITLPETGIRLKKLPPIHDTVSLAPIIPNSPLYAERPPMQIRNTQIRRKNKEPKFVPYEPYKGAVAKLEDEPRKRSESSLKSRSTSKSSIDSPVKKISETKCDIDSVITNSAVEEELSNNYRVMLDAKEAEIAELRAKTVISDRQLKLQTQVNSEIKKLLVASVGEDIEARVDFLTQDKARLAADVIQYSNRISKDWEEKESLSVESDVWRSKFLASSLIVDEMSKSKAALSLRAEELEHSSRRLLVERNQLRSCLINTQTVIGNLNSAFDPLSSAGEEQCSSDVLQMAAGVLRSSQRLAERLVGEPGRPVSPVSQAVVVEVDTAGERALKEILAKPMEATGGVHDLASSALAGKVKPLLVKLGDQATMGRGNEFQTCGHCHGSVHVV